MPNVDFFSTDNAGLLFLHNLVIIFFDCLELKNTGLLYFFTQSNIFIEQIGRTNLVANFQKFWIRNIFEANPTALSDKILIVFTIWIVWGNYLKYASEIVACL